MITALITFLGGATVRLFLGHLFDFLIKWQDQKNEVERMRVQGELEAAQHERNLAAIKLQADLGVRTIEVQSDAALSLRAADAFTEAVKAAGEKTGIQWVDLWNGIIRPLLATICIGLWICSLASRHWLLDDWDRALMSLALGVFVGGRIQATQR